MAVQLLVQRLPAGPASPPKRASSLVRRLAAATDDPAKERVRGWLAAIDDERLSAFGLTAVEIATLRASGRATQARHRSNS